jgi:glycosyltransferase involved in cell wall biosynthesis
VHLVALAESANHVCCRYRLAAFRSILAAAGHVLDIRSLPCSWFGRFTLGRDLTHADAVIVQRKLIPRLSVAMLRRRVRRLVFDFDDAVWLRDSYSAKGFHSPRRERRFRSLVRASDLVVAGNDYLAVEARRWADPDRVVVIPTCVDVAKYPFLGARPSRPQPVRAAGTAALPGIQLVWIGSASTLRGLVQFTPVLSAIGRAVPGTRLKLICDRFFEIPDLPVDQCTWNGATEAAEIAAADVGISWVPDDPWSRGKCGLKVLQYHAAGLPVIANPVGVQAGFVRDGMTGFRATTTEEWVNAVRCLAADPRLRQRLGAAGREQVEAGYSVAVGGRKWIGVLERFAKDGVRKTG